MASGDTLGSALGALAFRGAGTNPATRDDVEAGTDQPIPVLDFDSAQTEEAVGVGYLEGQYDGSGAIDVIVRGAMDSANTGTKKVRIDIKIMRLNVGQSIAADGFAAAQSVSITVDNTANEIFEGTVAFTNAQFDGVQGGEWFAIHIQRDHDHADDDATGDYQFIGAAPVED